jgi:hypothetical protein
VRNHKGGRRDMTESEERRFKGSLETFSFNNLIRCKVAIYGNLSPHARNDWPGTNNTIGYQLISFISLIPGTAMHRPLGRQNHT